MTRYMVQVVYDVIEACGCLDDEALSLDGTDDVRAQALRDASRAITTAICGTDGGTDDAREAVLAFGRINHETQTRNR